MKLSSSVAWGLAALPAARAWGGFGHITVAYIASNFVSDPTAAYFQTLLRNDTSDYLANVATWADSVRYTRWGRYTGVFHFIDAKDDPPHSCGVDLARDCKAEGCVVSAIHNYTSQLLPEASGEGGGGGFALPEWQRAQAAKFVIHFVGDIHQPLHDEDVARGGNGIHALWGGVELNLHHIWDTRIPERAAGGVPRRKPFEAARRWADELTAEIRTGGFRAQSEAWLDGIDLADPTATALAWAREGNAYVCSTVLPEGPKAIVGQELGGDYYQKAAPVVEVQIARAGYRLAAWLDLIAANITSGAVQSPDEL
ncbi:Nuclease S1 [Pleurostoma richardsiae]|uniref:Nuclease S1 n=1 Tax=Pleurostoma richardsiae TaxID=41990 RepID=A0AA38VNV5_9PEZI|nr:Nuclease S1 [Pleurostoma richardsiae]